MPDKRGNEMQAVLVGAAGQVKLSGTISACVITAFEHIAPGGQRSAAEVRELALKVMTEAHQRMTQEGR